MRHPLDGPWATGRLRVVLLALVALAAVADLTTYAVLVSREETSGHGVVAGPEVVARTVVQAVADDDCTGLTDLLADDADLPSPVTACLRGETGAAALTEVRVLDVSTDGPESSVTIGLRADGREASVAVGLRRSDDRWRVVSISAA